MFHTANFSTTENDVMT